MTEKAYIVCFTSDEEETPAESWATGTFEPYACFSDEERAKDTAKKLNGDLKAAGCKDTVAFVRAVSKSWALEMFGPVEE